MTQPVQEPTEGRAVAGLKWQTSQLFRRPLPPAAESGAPSYAYCFSYVTPQTVGATSNLQLAWEDFTTNALDTVFSTGGIATPNNNTTGDTRLWGHNPGYYLFYGDILWEDAVYERYFYFDTSFYVFNQNEVTGGADFPKDGVEPDGASALQERNTHAIMNSDETDNKISIKAYNRDSVDRDVLYATLAAVHWPMVADFAGTDVIYQS